MLRIALFSALILLPVLATAADQNSPPRPGMVLAMVDGRARWLAEDEIAGFPGYIIKYKAYAGDVLKTESEVAFIRGYPATITNSRWRGEYLEDGSYRQRTYFGTLLVAENPSLRHGLTREEYAPNPWNELIEAMLPKMQNFSFEDLDLYVFSHDADSFEVEIFRNDFTGYELQRVRVADLPVATRRAEAQPVYVGKYSGVLHRSDEVLYVEMPDSTNDAPLIDADGRLFRRTATGWKLVEDGQ